MKLPKKENPEIFEKMWRDVLAIKYGQDFELYGRKGQKQKGVDVRACLSENGHYIVAQCKNYLANNRKIKSRCLCPEPVQKMPDELSICLASMFPLKFIFSLREKSIH